MILTHESSRNEYCYVRDLHVVHYKDGCVTWWKLGLAWIGRRCAREIPCGVFGRRTCRKLYLSSCSGVWWGLKVVRLTLLNWALSPSLLVRSLVTATKSPNHIFVLIAITVWSIKKIFYVWLFQCTCELALIHEVVATKLKYFKGL